MKAAMFVALVSAPAAAPVRVSVEESRVADALVAGLVQELPDVAIVRAARDASVRVKAQPDGGALAVFAVTEGGEVLLSRRIPMDPIAPQPAVRLAVLLLAETVRAYAQQPAVEPVPPAEAPKSTAAPATTIAPVPDAAPIETGPAAATPPPRVRTATAPPGWLWLRTGLTGGFWSEPATPLVGVFGGVAARLGRVTAGVRVEVAGPVCCRLSDARFNGEVLEAALLAEGQLRLVRWGPVELSAEVAVGAAYVRVEGRPDDDPSFPVGLAEQSRSTWDPQARLAVGAQWSPWADGPTFGLGAGVQLRAARLVVRLPARDAAPPPVDPGPATPWVSLSASVPIF